MGVFNKPTQSCILKKSIDQPLTVTYGSVAPLPHFAPPSPPPAPSPSDWPSQVKGLYNVVEDPRELHDLQADLPDVVNKLHARLVHWNATTVPSIHVPNDPEGKEHRDDT